MKIHFVGGFLGSGKTTAIGAACGLRISKGEKVGVVTNDIGKYQVDSRFLDSAGIPTAEVSGACICGRYDDFLERLAALASKDRPRTIFVELIGSSVGMVDSIRRGLESYRGSGGTTLSVVADSRLMAAWLSGKALPFNDDIIYLFERQLAEANLLLLNKSDLLDSQTRNELSSRAKKRFPNLDILSLSFLQPEGAALWLSALDRRETGIKAPRFIVPFDQARYERAEQSLSWLETKLEFDLERGPGDNKKIPVTLDAFFEALWNSLSLRKAVPGHVKALVTESGSRNALHSVKVGFSSADAAYPLSAGAFSEIDSQSVEILLNARVLSSPEILSAALDAALEALKKLRPIRVRENCRSVRAPSAAAPSFPSASLRAPLPPRP